MEDEMDITNQTLYALLPISFLGSILNWTIFYAIQRLECFNHSFGFLSANQALVDGLHSTTFLLYFCPMVLLDNAIMKEMSHHCGFVLLLCYELSVMIHLAISLNRFCAVWIPYQYHNIFNEKNSKILIILIWLFTGSVAIYLYEILCHIYYEDKSDFLTFTDSKLCANIGWYGDFVKNACIVAVIMLIDILTVIKVRRMSRKISVNITEQAQNKLSSREMRFLKQTVTQGSVFLLELLTYFFIPQYFSNKWIVFFGTSFAWVAVHAVDGLVVVIFNPEVRKFLLCKETKKRVSSMNRISS
ncbi:G-protein coupled receptors family 1 profile domain-containing protein [Caenorhabditis elegans]|uniref:G-protein coupled receptors family 1 profile domain-containing protein n=1 Tax=Caenorhabditis elegans TaxID=6239 RepID=Q9N5J0_CAEEL|nr:G-protein coupled receptors family 1 profile domain-containing protein [Caenorhabditis elegans]CCD61376.1 G-protein coupled receptors family 1 profile domain-containing protein [Caenorhabditis elegans]|eukprot:NP_504114.1 Serpentine Receptor, class X [Caenorhabditis elegans]